MLLLKRPFRDLFSVMSRATFDAPTIRPELSFSGEIVRDISAIDPSLRFRTVSKCSIRSPRLSRARISASSAKRSSGTMSVIFLPIASSAV
jgi:hypothetical protein